MRGDRERLGDIVGTAARVAELVALGRERLESDTIVQDAMIRRLEVIGEAAANVSSELRDRQADVPWRHAAAMRNHAVHGIFDVDLQQVWSTATTDVPAMAARVQQILDETS